MGRHGDGETRRWGDTEMGRSGNTEMGRSGDRITTMSPKNSRVTVAPSSKEFHHLNRRPLKGMIWGDENPPEWRIFFQPGFVPFRSSGFRFAGFAWTSDFQTDRHSCRSARGCRRNAFSISPAAFARFAVFCRQARREPESRLWRVFENGARRNVLAPNCWEAGVRFPSHRRSCPVRMPQLAVQRFSPPSAAAPPGLERKAWIPALRALSSATPPDFNGLSRMRGMRRPTRETRAPAGMTGHGNT